MKKLLVILAFSLAALVATRADAQAATRVTPCSATTADSEVCLNVTPGTTLTTGTPAVLGSQLRFEQKTGAGAWTLIGTMTAALPTTNRLVTGLAPGDYTWRVFQVYLAPNAPTSAPSNELGKTIAQPGTVAPVLIIAATIRADGPPVFRVVATITPRAGEYLVMVPGRP